MGTESERVARFGRLEDGLRQAGEWYRWGPYVSERQWGTVRGTAGVRVGLRRRQPAGARLGGAAGLRHRRRPRPGIPQPGLRQAPGQLHLVGEYGGRRGQQRLRGRLPGPGQHRPDRPLPPTRGLHPGAVRCHRLDGRLRAGDGCHGRRPQLVRLVWSPPGPGSGPEVPGALRGHPERPGPAGPVGRRRRAVLRPADHPLRLRRPGEGPVHGRDHPRAGRGGHRRQRAAERDDYEQAVHALPAA